MILFTWALRGEEFVWKRDLGLLLVLGLIAAPYLLVHDLVLLLPAVLSTALCVTRWKSRSCTLTATLVFGLLCIAMWIDQITQHHIIQSVWIAPLMLIPAALSRNCIGRPPQSC